MPRIVMKFGGTSMAGIERIRNVAERVQARGRAQGNEVLVVVSAMAGETDRLVQLCREAAALYDPKEYDVVVASGEQVTSGPARHDASEHGREGAQLHGLAAASARRRPRQCAGSKRSIPTCSTRRSEGRHGRRHPRIPGRQRGRPRRDARPRRLGHVGRRASPPASRPTAATSTPTSTASTRPTRASSHGRASSTR